MTKKKNPNPTKPNEIKTMIIQKNAHDISVIGVRGGRFMLER